MFLDTGCNFGGLKTLTAKKMAAVAAMTHVRVVVNRTLPRQL